MSHVIERGALLPSVRLHAASNGTPTDLRAGAGARVVLVAHSADCAACRRFVRDFAPTSREIAEWGGRTLVVVPGDRDAAAAFVAPAEGIEVLADSDSRLGVTGALVAVADEWGEIFATFDIDETHDFPSGPELLEWTRFITIQCPECEGPEGEWRTL